jgi:hypothetical protein
VPLLLLLLLLLLLPLLLLPPLLLPPLLLLYCQLCSHSHRILKLLRATLMLPLVILYAIQQQTDIPPLLFSPLLFSADIRGGNQDARRCHLAWCYHSQQRIQHACQHHGHIPDCTRSCRYALLTTPPPPLPSLSPLLSLFWC